MFESYIGCIFKVKDSKCTNVQREYLVLNRKKIAVDSEVSLRLYITIKYNI